MNTVYSNQTTLLLVELASPEIEEQELLLLDELEQLDDVDDDLLDDVELLLLELLDDVDEELLLEEDSSYPIR